MKELIIIVDDEKMDIEGNAPVVDKPQELVRCKDCICYRYYGPSEEIVSECTINHCKNPDADWFCADGERKEGR